MRDEAVQPVAVKRHSTRRNHSLNRDAPRPKSGANQCTTTYTDQTQFYLLRITNTSGSRRGGAPPHLTTADLIFNPLASLAINFKPYF